MNLNLEKKIATLTAVALDYYTEAQRDTEIQVLTESALAAVSRAAKRAGAKSRSPRRSSASRSCAGSRRRTWAKSRSTCPPTELQTTGYWLSLSERSG